jgi:hypothetical protein
MQFNDALSGVNAPVRKGRPPQGRKPAPYGGGRGSFSRDEAHGLDRNPKLTGDVVNVDEASKLIRALAEVVRAKNPNLPWAEAVSQATNEAARTQQWSKEVGDAAAWRAMEWGRQAGGGYAPGYKDGTAAQYAAKRSAHDELVDVAKKLRETDPTLTDAGAYVKAREARKDLAARENAERMAKFGYAVGADGLLKVVENVI